MTLEQVPGVVDKERSPWLRAGKVLASLGLAGSLLSGDMSTHSKRTLRTTENTRVLSEAEQRALHALQCRQVDNARRAASKSEGVGRGYRERVLRGIWLATSCVGFPDENFRSDTACIAVKKEIDAHPPGWFGRYSVLLPLLQNLKDELQCRDTDSISVKELFVRLKVEIERDPPKILNPETTLRSICAQSVELVKRHKEDITSLSAYMLRTFPPETKIGARIEEWKNNYMTTHKVQSRPTPEILQKSVEKNVGRLVTWSAIASGFCWWNRNSSDLTIAQNVREDITEAELKKNRREIFTLLAELVETVAKDLEAKKPEAEKAYGALQRIARSIASVK